MATPSVDVAPTISAMPVGAVVVAVAEDISDDAFDAVVVVVDGKIDEAWFGVIIELVVVVVVVDIGDVLVGGGVGYNIVDACGCVDCDVTVLKVLGGCEPPDDDDDDELLLVCDEADDIVDADIAVPGRLTFKLCGSYTIGCGG